MKTLQDAASLASHERGPGVISTLRANGTIQSSLVNAGVLAHPASGDTVLALVTVGSIKLANLRARPQITGGYARASYASGGGGASRVPRIAGDVTAGSALVSCVLVGYAPCAERRRF